jgi:hypothetical protein
MASDQPGSGGWTSPGGAADPPPYYAEPAPSGPADQPPPPPGWGVPPPPPPPPYGWTQPPYGWGPPQPPRPGIIPLRPLAVGEILDGAFTTIRRYPGATLGLTAPVMLVVEVVRIIVSYWLLNGINTNVSATNGNTFGDFAGRTATVEIIVGIVTLVATALLSGVIATIVGQGALGRPMSATEAWNATVPAFWRLLGTSLLVLLIVVAIAVVGAVPGVVILAAGATGPGIAVAILGGLATSVYAIYVGVSLSLATPALMLEKQGVFEALRRSRLLVRGSWWRVFGITVLAGIITAVIAGIIGTPFALAGGGLSGIFSGNTDAQYQFTALVVSGIGGLIGSTLVRPFSSGVTALLYLDRRMRAEGLDQTLQQAAANAAR